jgi:DNA-3-methyladenine glycosylase II
MSTLLRCTLPLPEGFRVDDMLSFQRRDPQALAERVNPSGLEKGLMWHGLPACLSLQFRPGRVDAELAVDGPSQDQPAFEALVQRMLGLSQDVARFEQQHRDHPQIGRLLASQAGLRVPMASSPFEALVWAVTGQQISLGVAVSIRRKLLLAVGRRHSSGLLCFPQAEQIAALDLETLRQASYSAAKAQTLLGLARLIVDDQLPLEDWLQTLPVDDIRQRLLAVRGVGPWTVDYTLLRGFGWLDGSLHGDVAVRRGLQRLLAAPEKISEKQAQAWLAEFAPWRALLAAHLWAAQTAGGY